MEKLRPYKLKHIPTGMYYQPHKHRGSNLSERGKIYQTKGNILSISYFSNGDKRKIITVFIEKDSRVHKKLQNSKSGL